MTTFEIGDKITVRKGWGYNVYDPSGFERSDGKVEGTITAAHDNPNTLYFKLDDGRIASTGIAGMEKIPTKVVITWVPADVQSLVEGISDANADAFLARNGKHLRDRSIELGWSVLEDLLHEEGIGTHTA